MDVFLLRPGKSHGFVRDDKDDGNCDDYYDDFDDMRFRFLAVELNTVPVVLYRHLTVFTFALN
jgi:hypothetical protein